MNDDKNRPPNAPVRVKVYGLVSLTRRAYLLCQSFGLTLGLILMAVGIWGPRVGVGDFFAQFLNVLPAVCLVILAAGALETVVVLQQFRRKEAQQQRQQTTN